MNNDNIKVKRFRFEIKPTKDQIFIIDQIFDDCRKVRNLMINNLQKRFGEIPDFKYKPLLKGRELSKELPKLKEAIPYLSRTSSKAIQMNVLDLGKAYDNYFDKAFTKSGVSRITKEKDKKKFLPNFKSYKQEQSFGLTRESFRLVGKEFYILTSKIKSPIKVFWSRDLPSDPSSITIIKTVTKRYFVSFVCKYEAIRESGEGIIGIDVGLRTYGVTSDPNDKPIQNPKYLEKSLKRLKNLQKKLARAIKGSKNWEKLRMKIAKLHEKIKNQRKDFQHKVTSKIVKTYKTVVVEKLNIVGLFRKAKSEKQKAHARNIADASWGQFRTFLEYKILESLNGQIIIADPHFPSTQLCSECNQYPKVKLELKDREHSCKCGKTMDRDYNAALNLKQMVEALFRYRPELADYRLIMAPKYEDFLFYPEYQPVN